MRPGKPLQPEQLYQRCDPELFDFNTSAELEEQTETPGQERAVEAIDFATEMELSGFNLFILGPQGTGRHSAARRILKKKEAQKPTADDWCYVNNFDNPKRPRYLRMPAAQGNALRRDIEQLIEEAHRVIPAAFESEDYRTRRQAIEEEFNEYQEKVFGEVQKSARERSISIIQTPTGLAFVPLHDDKAISSKEYAQLPKEEQEQLNTEAQLAEREGDLARVAEIRYGKALELEKSMEEANQKLSELQQASKMLKEEVDAEDIAEVVSKWTGIPVSKMLEGEKEKLIHMEDRLTRRVIGQQQAIAAEIAAASQLTKHQLGPIAADQPSQPDPHLAAQHGEDFVRLARNPY